MRLNKIFILFVFVVFFLTGCSQNISIANTNLAIEFATNNTRLQNEWLDLDTGVQFKEIPVYANNNALSDVITVFKFNPNKFTFSFQQANPALTVNEWQDKYQPLFVCNGSYFLENNQPAGLLKIAGETFGSNLTSESVGELVINDQGKLDILENADINKYNNILQSYPLLSGIKEDSGQVAPRTVVAKDNKGNILFIFTKEYYFSLYKLQNYLKNSDLNIEIALNLDGGPSTGYNYSGLTKKSSPSQPVANVIMVNKKAPR